MNSALCTPFQKAKRTFRDEKFREDEKSVYWNISADRIRSSPPVSTSSKTNGYAFQNIYRHRMKNYNL